MTMAPRKQAADVYGCLRSAIRFTEPFGDCAGTYDHSNHGEHRVRHAKPFLSSASPARRSARARATARASIRTGDRSPIRPRPHRGIRLAAGARVHALLHRLPRGRGRTLGLRLTEDASYAAIVNQPSVERPALKRVDPGNPDASYLLQKVSGTAAVGGRMPLGGPPLPADAIAALRQWILDGAAAPRNVTTVVVDRAPGAARRGLPGRSGARGLRDGRDRGLVEPARSTRPR